MTISKAVINWFTKMPETVENTPESIISELKKRIGHEHPNSLQKFGDALFQSLKEIKDFSCIPADTRLPVCSLFHHLKNTTALAVCYGVDEGWEQEKIQALRVASLLHDLGKIKDFQNHVDILPMMVEDVMEPFALKSQIYRWKDEIKRLASQHHSNRDPKPSGDERVLTDADSASSAADRLYEISLVWPEDGKEQFLRGEEVEITIRSSDSIFPHAISMNQDISEAEPFTLGKKGEKRIQIKDIHGKFSRQKENKRWLDVEICTDKTVNGKLRAYFGGPWKNNKKVALFLMDIGGIQRYIMEVKRLPLMRGASNILTEIEERVANILSDSAGGSPEVVLLKGGGKVMGFLPASVNRDDVKTHVEQAVAELSAGGLHPAIAITEVTYQDLGGNFDTILVTLFEESTREKNKIMLSPALDVRDSELCGQCRNRKWSTTVSFPDDRTERICDVCHRKHEAAKIARKGNQDDFIIKNDHLNESGNHVSRNMIPHTTRDLGVKMAAVQIDGNMIGKLFTQTMTPAEYDFKSTSFDEQFMDALKETIASMVQKKKAIFFEENDDGEEHIGIEVIYAGGDDLFLLLNAKSSLIFVHEFIRRIKERFAFRGTEPLVTISAGIAMADCSFPVYFLQQRADELMHMAKSKFRQYVTRDERTGIFQRPHGALAVSAVTSSMPGKDEDVFVLGRTEDEVQLNKIMHYLQGCVDPSDENLKKRIRSQVSVIVQTEEGSFETMNAIKELYANAPKKKLFEHENILDGIENLIDCIKDEPFVRTMKRLTPMFWGGAEE